MPKTSASNSPIRLATAHRFRVLRSVSAAVEFDTCIPRPERRKVSRQAKLIQGKNIFGRMELGAISRIVFSYLHTPVGPRSWAAYWQRIPADIHADLQLRMAASTSLLTDPRQSQSAQIKIEVAHKYRAAWRNTCGQHALFPRETAPPPLVWRTPEKGLMKNAYYDEIKPARKRHDGSTMTDPKRRNDRQKPSIDEGWDVGGPRWRIGWGGLAQKPDAGYPERR
jgi:hypothetical protein